MVLLLEAATPKISLIEHQLYSKIAISMEECWPTVKFWEVFPTSFQRNPNQSQTFFLELQVFHPVPEKRLGRRATWEEVFEEKIR